MLESLSKNTVFMRVTFESPSKMLHVQRNLNISYVIGGWGWKRSGAETPTGNPSPAPIAIAPHARQINGAIDFCGWGKLRRFALLTISVQKFRPELRQAIIT